MSDGSNSEDRGGKFKLRNPDGTISRTSVPGEIGGNAPLRIYGRLDCWSAKAALAKGGYARNRVFFRDEEAAIASGFRPCGHCMKESYAAWKRGGRIGSAEYPWLILPPGYEPVSTDDDIDLERAISIAVRAHAGQKGKSGAPYILHPLRVMLSLESEDDRIVAVLHDVLEDGRGSEPEEVRRNLDPQLLAALEAVTKTADEEGSGDYMAFIQRAAANPIARRVKLADLRDNLDVLRLPRLEERDRERINKYLEAYKALNGV